VTNYAPAPAPQRPASNGNVGTVATVIGVVIAVVALVVAYLAWQKPKPPIDPPPPDGRPAYIAQADSLCRTAIKRFAAYGPMPKGDNDALITWIDGTGAVFDDLYARWTAIPIPSGDDKPVRAILDAFKSFNANLHAAQKSAHQAVVATDDEDFQRITSETGREYDQAMNEAITFDNAVDAYGMNGCTGLMHF
jgi:hypothetical protein